MALNTSQFKLSEEAKVRGLCAAVSADMEGLLLRIILYCIVDQPSEALRKFSKMTLGSKIQWAKKDLEKYQTARYKTHENDFEELMKFNKIRGHLIHCDFVWDDETYQSFKVLDIQNINGEWHIVPVPYNKNEIAKSIFDFGQLILRFAFTAKDIIEEVSKKYPELIKSPIAS